MVNTIIGQGVLIIGFSALAKILFSNGINGLKELAKRNEASQ